MKWAVSPFSANPHSGRRCHLKSMLVSSVHIPKAARRRKFRSTDIETPTAHFGGSAYIKTSKKTKARQPAYTMNRNKSLPQEAPPKKRTVRGSQPQIAEIPSYHLPETTRPPGPGRGTLWGFSAKPDPPLQYTGLLLWVCEPPTTRKDL